VIGRLGNRLSYANVVATLALFVALGGTSYAVLQVGSNAVVDNSLRSRDIPNNTVRVATYAREHSEPATSGAKAWGPPPLGNPRSGSFRKPPMRSALEEPQRRISV
jgi:hypothetical protein